MVDGKTLIIGCHKAGVCLAGSGGTDADGDAVGDDVCALVGIAYGVALEKVESVESSLLTGGGLVACEAVVAAEQVVCKGALSNIDSPARTDELLDYCVIAESYEKHLCKLVAGDIAFGVEGAVAVTGNDALLNAVGNAAGRPAVCCNIGEGGFGSGKIICGYLSDGQIADDLCCLLTGELTLGLKFAAYAIEHADGGHNIGCLFVAYFIVVRVGSAGNTEHTENHDENKHKRQCLTESFHVRNSSLVIVAAGGPVLCTRLRPDILGGRRRKYHNLQKQPQMYPFAVDLCKIL